MVGSKGKAPACLVRSFLDMEAKEVESLDSDFSDIEYSELNRAESKVSLKVL